MLLTVFLICSFIVFYTFLGYGVLIYGLARWTPYRRPVLPARIDEDLPAVVLFIAAYNEADIIAAKMDNCLSLDYPREKLHILWVIDGSTDESAQLLGAYPVQVIYSPDRRGKTAAINHGMQYVEAPIVIFSDANCMLNAASIRRMVLEFEDAEIGCVSGEKRVAAAADDAVSSKGEGMYWRYESFLKARDFVFYSAVGAAGELFAIRTTLFKAMPEDTLLDDFMLSMGIAKAGFRIAYTPDAYAVERGSVNMEEEAKRKKRIAAGGWQSMGRLLPLLNFLKYPRLSFQYISHRVLRWSVTPFALFALLPLSLMLAYGCVSHSNVYTIIVWVQLLFYLCAGIGYLQRNEPTVSKFFYLPYYFVFMNANVVLGLIYLFRNNKIGVWEKAKRK